MRSLLGPGRSGNGLFYLARTFSRRKLSTTTKTKRATPLPLIDKFEALQDQAKLVYRSLDRIPTGEAPIFINPDSDSNRNPLGFYMGDFLNSAGKRL